jgi:hypothetical protein
MGMSMNDEQVLLQMKILFGNQFFFRMGHILKHMNVHTRNKTTPRFFKLEVEIPFHHKNIQ